MTSASPSASRPRGRSGRKTERREPRAYRVSVRYSEREYERLTASAAGAGLSISQYLRATDPKIAAPRRNLPPVAHEILGELRRIGNNVNQAVRLCHQGRVPQEFLPNLLALDGSLRDFAALLVGDGSIAAPSKRAAP